MDKERILQIIESKDVINVTFKDRPVWLVPNDSDTDELIHVKDLETHVIKTVNIAELNE